MYPSGRRRIVDLLAATPQPLSIPEMLALDRDAAQSSVYRNLAVLELAGVVNRIVTADEFARFELAEEMSGHHHHHLICTSCGSVQDITLPTSVENTVTRELQRVAIRHGFSPTGHQMDLVGVCAGCQ